MTETETEIDTSTPPIPPFPEEPPDPPVEVEAPPPPEVDSPDDVEGGA